jgi:hypothetical protein
MLGFVSVLLTGGIGLLQLDPKWIAVKEAAVPAVIGLAGRAVAAHPLPDRADLPVQRQDHPGAGRR